MFDDSLDVPPSEFDPTQFILTHRVAAVSRALSQSGGGVTPTSLEALRSQLDACAKQAEESIIDSVNQHYDRFVRISGKLATLDDSIIELQSPLQEMVERVAAPSIPLSLSLSFFSFHFSYI